MTIIVAFAGILSLFFLPSPAQAQLQSFCSVSHANNHEGGKVSSLIYCPSYNYTVTSAAADNERKTNSDPIAIESAEPPAIEIIKANMISPAELGIAVKVNFPEISSGIKRFVKFNATINGKSVEESFDISELTEPGKESEIGTDNNGNITPDTILKINFKKQQVERFTENEKFDLKAVAYYASGDLSEESIKDVEILLPVVIVHGLLGEFGGLQPSFGDPDALKILRDFLSGYGYKQTPGTYQTLYSFDYSSLDSCVTDAIMLKKKIQKNVLKKTYANKVNIVSHSMGGLISRYSISYNSLPVNKLIMIGTPNKGSTLASMAKANLPQFLYAIFKTPLEQLTPTYDYLYDSSDGQLNTKLQKIFKNKFLTKLNNKSLSDTIKYYSIFNSSIETPKGLSVTSFSANRFSYEIKSDGSGDNTVLSDSAVLEGAENIDIGDASEAGRHSILPANESVLTHVKEILMSE